MSFDVSAAATGSYRSRGVRWPAASINFVLFSALVVASQGAIPTRPTLSHTLQSSDKSDQSYYANAHPYFEEPPKQLVKRIPQLKSLRPTQDQQELPMILVKTGESVDDFFRNIVDLTVQEEIKQEWAMRQYRLKPGQSASERVRDSYLILRRGKETGTDIVEYRVDANGNRADQVGIDKGYFVSSGFALIGNHFSTGFQSESTFRYLGDERIGSQDTYVVGFAQQPGKATLPLTMREREGVVVHMLLQGVAWVDKNNFQIIRMRTDLLAPRSEIGLKQQTTEVTFNEVKLLDVATPLWLPSDVKVYVDFKPQDIDYGQFYERTYRNEHRYANYQRYRVAVKILAPQ